MKLKIKDFYANRIDRFIDGHFIALDELDNDEIFNVVSYFDTIDQSHIKNYLTTDYKLRLEEYYVLKDQYNDELFLSLWSNNEWELSNSPLGTPIAIGNYKQLIQIKGE
jgi:hypothetical protein